MLSTARMLCRVLAATAVLASFATSASDLTEVEARWLKAAIPALSDAKARALPVDVVVQPQDTSGQAPLAMDFVDGRCKLVLSMRGNPAADAVLGSVEPALAPLLIEAMAAHEVAHCWRHVNGTWNVLPAGFADPASEGLADSERARWRREMRQTRREEAFADLVALAWTLERHPAQFERVHAWFERVRDDSPLAGSHHDTRAWLELAKRRSAFGAGDHFEQAERLWREGLRSDH